MPIVERDLTSFTLPSSAPKQGSSLTSFTLISSPNATFKHFTYTLSFPLPSTYRVTLTGPDRPQPPHDNVILKSSPRSFKLVKLDAKACSAVFSFPEQPKSRYSREIRLSWVETIMLDVYETDASTGKETRLIGDLPGRSYALTEHGIMRHWWIERNNLHLGLGEKAAPIDLTGRSFQMHGSDSACYDAYEGDPLYKHTPFLISTPRPTPRGEVPNSTYAIYHPTNSNAVWDLGRLHDDPWGYFKRFTQDWGGLEEWVLVGERVADVVQTWGEIVGKPKLVGRDWLGYLASGMGLGETDHPIAQELLSAWPELCKKHDIPCSAMHLSSGYTVGDDGNRYVFHMNTKRYPDFKGMVGVFHKAGIKVVPNIKPYVLQTHQNYKELHSADALFHDPWTKAPVVTRIWSSGVGDNAKGSWVDMTSEEGREWWRKGVQSLIDLGVDGMWDDNNEYFLHDDAFISRNKMPVDMASPADGPTNVGLMGRQINTEMMNKTSHDALVAANPERRPMVLTRSGNVGTFKYANSTWTGDNETSWKNLRGSQHIQLNASLSLMQSTGSDIGGFGGPLPDPEMMVRWVQLGVTHSRFCIHSFKPNKDDPSGSAQTNTPWMYPEMLPVIRQAIKWRYELLPFFNNLMWLSHTGCAPALAPLFFGPFASDLNLYTRERLEGFDAWIGAGQLLSAPALFPGMLTRDVYFPKSHPDDQSVYFDLHAPYGQYAAGTIATISTPIDHMGLFALLGAAIPVGKDYATVTSTSGPARTHTDGVDVVLEDEGGVVGLDDWRGVLLFPGSKGEAYTREWTEDDGISAEPAKAVIVVEYKGTDKSVEVKMSWKESAFRPLWGKKVHVVLPVGDEREVKGAKEVGSWKERKAYVVELA